MSRYCEALAGLVLAGLLLCIVCCKTPPSPSDPSPEYPVIPEAINPTASLRFVSIEAHDISLIKLSYILSVGFSTEQLSGTTSAMRSSLLANLDPAEAQLIISKRSVIVNNTTTDITPEVSLEKATFSVTETGDKKAAIEIPVSLELVIPSLIAAGVPLTDDFTVELAMDLLQENTLRVPVSMHVSETTVFPYVREPIFTITAIAILKAELINTRFRVSMRIDNPNHFPVTLSAFKYELYGDGLSWASGTERRPLDITPKTSVVINFFLLMNFIDMSRSLLDQIIRLDYVNYRFNGEVFVSTGVDYLPSFKSEFDLSGYSEVLDN
jgi:LEA14-like dessication related protein